MDTSTVSEAMLMAAGLGTRLRPFTYSVSKAMIPLMGIPISQYVLDSLTHSGVTHVVANVHHLAEETQKGLLGLTQPQGTSHPILEISDESKMLLGSAGGIRHALSKFKTDRFFYANGDVLCDIDWMELASRHFKLKAQYGVQVTLAVFPRGPVGETYREILFDPATRLVTSLGERQVGRPYFIGAAVIEKEACENIPLEGPSEFVPTLLEPAIRKGKAGVFLTSGSWFDLGSPDLWFRTHLSLINQLETGNLRSRIGRIWGRKMEETNFRLADRIWIEKGAPRPKHSARWAGPSYWSPYGASEPLSLAPEEFGPGAILYGNPTQSGLQNGIGMNRLWYSAK